MTVDPASSARRTAAVLTVSDRGYRGETVDTAGPAVTALLVGAGFEVVTQVLLPDEAALISERLHGWSEGEGLALVITVGGTGLSPRDRTPEATVAVTDYLVPGIPEAMRTVGRASTPLAALSRGVAAVRRGTLIVNLPGSERGATESLRAILEVLPHAIDQLEAIDHAPRPQP
ncbi:MAG: MogA/MoaB family molybdenum cofactor biosynthesis protein [Dehalococcoidia bacterium]|nr:MogA/MoaB family molybdenum cofactor biosynthesis protein [Dehalococcoidia bacterium]